MTKIIASVKAIITRLVFASHGLVAIWQVTNTKRNPLFWYLSSPIVLLFFEGIFTLTIKANQEWKWFCPSVFLYLGSVVPAIWLLELDKVERRWQSLQQGPSVLLNDTLDLSNVEDLKQLQRAIGVNIRLPELQISRETWVTLIEQFLMLILIVGRWMLPKGDLTRDQLSQLLLVYIGTAADIIEFFDSFKEDKVARESLLVYLTLAIWSWSLMQFTVVLSATKSRKSRLSSSTSSGVSRTSCSIDLWAIAVNMLLQDAPFLGFRLILIAHYRIVSYMNVFFTCKNSLVIVLQLYRLCVVQSEARAGRKRRLQARRATRHGRLALLSTPDSYGLQLQNGRGKRRGRALVDHQRHAPRKRPRQHELSDLDQLHLSRSSDRSLVKTKRQREHSASERDSEDDDTSTLSQYEDVESGKYRSNRKQQPRLANRIIDRSSEQTDSDYQRNVKYERSKRRSNRD